MGERQRLKWSGGFGKFWADQVLRPKATVEGLNAHYLNSYGVTRTELNSHFINYFETDMKILEVGTGLGVQLQLLKEEGFENLYGVDCQEHTLDLAREMREGIIFKKGTASDLPFEDNSFDVVLTSKLLTLIPPQDIDRVLDEIYRCSRQFIWGFEACREEGNVSGEDSWVWLRDFPILYARKDNLKKVKEREQKLSGVLGRKCKTLTGRTMFLFEKQKEKQGFSWSTTIGG